MVFDESSAVSTPPTVTSALAKPAEPVGVKFQFVMLSPIIAASRSDSCESERTIPSRASHTLATRRGSTLLKYESAVPPCFLIEPAERSTSSSASEILREEIPSQYDDACNTAGPESPVCVK